MRNTAILSAIVLVVLTTPVVADTIYSPRCMRDCVVGCVIGAGSSLGTSSGADFDRDVLAQLYKLNYDLIVVAEAGLQSQDQDIRNFSRKLISQRKDVNARIARCLQSMSCAIPCPDGYTGACVKQCLLYVGKPSLGNDFARVMRILLKDSETTARLASIKAENACVRSVISDTIRTSMNNANAFARFLDDGFLTQQNEERYCIMNPKDPRCPM